MATEVELKLSAAGVRAATLGRALDELDRFGELLPASERQRITRAAFEGIELPSPPQSPSQKQLRLAARALETRGLELERELAQQGHSFSRGLPAGATPILLSVAALAGGASNALGPEKAISVLALPLLGLILWNLGLFVWIVISTLRSALVPGSDAPGSDAEGRLDGWVRRGLSRFDGTKGPTHGAEEAPLGVRIRRRHLDDWLSASMPLERARWSARLHLAAAVVVAATVAGMYLRGLTFEYRATWESTFLTVDAVQGLLGTLLSPALLLLGAELPPLEPLRAPATGPAALWIHAWALTATLFVIAPRLLLAAFEQARVARLSRRLPLRLPVAYVRRLLAAASTTPHEVHVTPYSYRPVEKSTETLRRLLLDFLGARASLRIMTGAAYGDEAEPSAAGWQVLLFSLAQTPEVEVHGEWLGQYAEQLADGQQLLVLVDEGPLLAKVPDAQRLERRESRRRAWLRNLDTGQENGPAPIFLALDEALDADLALDTLARGVWPEPAEKRGRKAGRKARAKSDG